MISSFSKSLSPRDRRALTWGGAIVAGALAISFVVKPYLATLEDAQSELSVQRDLLARERAVIRDANTFVAALDRSRSALIQRSTPLFDGTDELSATAGLSDHISNTAVANRVLVHQLDTRKAEVLEEGMVALGVDIRAEGDFEGVLRFLNSLERGDKLTHVTALVLTRVDRPVAAGAPDMEVLSVAGTITGYATFPPTVTRVADSARPTRMSGQ